MRLRREKRPPDPIVAEAQRHLVKLGFPIGAYGPNKDGIDGLMGQMTRGAIKTFQAMTGLPPTGQPDGATVSALGEAAGAGKIFRGLARAAQGRGVKLEIDPKGSNADFVNAVFFKSVPDEDRTGVPAVITTAQANLESGYGRQVPVDHQDGRYSYNLFGIKGAGPAGSVTVWTYEQFGEALVKLLADFRAYHDYDESIGDHSALLRGSSRYRNLFASKDPAKWAYGLQADGYATDPRYARKLIDQIDLWNLR